MFALLAIGLAHAGLFAVPPPGTTDVGLLLCGGAACADRVWWATNEPPLRDEMLLLIDSLLADDTAAYEDGVTGKRAFQEALEKARLALVDKKWSAGERALDDAEALLRDWRGTADTADLFALYYMRGAAVVGADSGGGADSFRRAAAVAWNRTVEPPAGLEGFADAYYKELAELVHDPLGTIVIDGGSSATDYYLDGVKLGVAPLRVQVFPGNHRLTALDRERSLAWRAGVVVVPRETTTTRASFGGARDPEEVAELLGRAVETRQMDPDVGELLMAWADRRHIKSLHLCRLDQDPSGKVSFSLKDVWYEPRLRRFSTNRP